ncbi:alpha/beta fold hydrolase [Streptomyces sp. ME19-01-6]|uniref:alpha/beta fold hydrolase n=1 Tax=Streptomyces sp. ME19-01-6 TaxID=3028686 RepID=UPI0029B0AC29|nr:alpha/beta fold hydrolase [Streptomyces sp. ME19-01-6]MDX3228333.1 alpha/beta fold hydrolase [Streptomyces sp. ME19-01-6]
MSPSPPSRLPHHRADGPADAPLLVLGPSLGTSTAIWDAYLPALAADHRVLRFDLPGHGGSPAELLGDPEPGSTTVEDLASLVLDLVDFHGRDRFHYAGISLGGAIGAQLAVRCPERIASLVLLCTSARFGEPQPWRERAESVRLKGMGPLLAASPGRWFADPGTAGTPVGRALLQNLADTDPAGYAACCDALAAYDLRADLRRIKAPTLVIGGTQDVATPLHHARELAGGIPGATLTTVGCGHLALEEPRKVELALHPFLAATRVPHTSSQNRT